MRAAILLKLILCTLVFWAYARSDGVSEATISLMAGKEHKITPSSLTSDAVVSPGQDPQSSFRLLSNAHKNKIHRQDTLNRSFVKDQLAGKYGPFNINRGTKELTNETGGLFGKELSLGKVLDRRRLIIICENFANYTCNIQYIK